MKIPVVQYPGQQLVLSVFLMLSILVGMTGVLIYISLITNDIEYFSCIIGYSYIFFYRVPQSFAHFIVFNIFFELYAFYLFYIQFFLPDIYSYIFSYSIKYQILHGSVLDIIKQPHVEPV